VANTPAYCGTELNLSFMVLNDFRINYSYLLVSKHSLPTLTIKVLELSILNRLSVYPTQASLLGRLITFVNNFNFKLVIMFVSFVN
jgi:hypothetical protein